MRTIPARRVGQVAFGMQAGFRAERGAIGDLFAVMVGLKMRQENGLTP